MISMSNVLYIDDELALGSLVSSLLKAHGHDVRCAASAEAAVAAMHERVPNLVLLDLHMGETDGMDLLRRFRSTAPNVPVVMVTGHGNVQNAVTAMKLGAVDFVTKPFNNQEFLRTLNRLLAAQTTFAPLLAGKSPQLLEALDAAQRFARTNINVMLLGETGTGKELFARTIHEASSVHAGKFFAVDCSTLSEALFESELFGHERGAFTGAVAAIPGRLEQAHGGTLFLDEIGNLPLGLQAKLLRVLQERCFVRVGGRESIQLDARIISATNVDLLLAIRDGRFRADLYYRFNEACVLIPALRERTGDIALLAHRFAGMHALRFDKPAPSISPAALCALEDYSWPGNVRELENVMKVAVVMADDVILPAHLPASTFGELPCVAVLPVEPALIAAEVPEGSDDEPLHLSIDVDWSAAEVDLRVVFVAAERALLSALIHRRQLRGPRLARLLNVDPKTLRAKLRKHGLSEA